MTSVRLSTDLNDPLAKISNKFKNNKHIPAFISWIVHGERPGSSDDEDDDDDSSRTGSQRRARAPTNSSAIPDLLDNLMFTPRQNISEIIELSCEILGAVAHRRDAVPRRVRSELRDCHLAITTSVKDANPKQILKELFVTHVICAIVQNPWDHHVCEDLSLKSDQSVRSTLCFACDTLKGVANGSFLRAASPRIDRTLHERIVVITKELDEWIDRSLAPTSHRTGQALHKFESPSQPNPGLTKFVSNHTTDDEDSSAATSIAVHTGYTGPSPASPALASFETSFQPPARAERAIDRMRMNFNTSSGSSSDMYASPPEVTRKRSNKLLANIVTVIDAASSDTGSKSSMLQSIQSGSSSDMSEKLEEIEAHRMRISSPATTTAAHDPITTKPTKRSASISSVTPTQHHSQKRHHNSTNNTSNSRHLSALPEAPATTTAAADKSRHQKPRRKSQSNHGGSSHPHASARRNSRGAPPPGGIPIAKVLSAEVLAQLDRRTQLLSVESGSSSDIFGPDTDGAETLPRRSASFNVMSTIADTDFSTIVNDDSEDTPNKEGVKSKSHKVHDFDRTSMLVSLASGSSADLSDYIIANRGNPSKLSRKKKRDEAMATSSMIVEMSSISDRFKRLNSQENKPFILEEPAPNTCASPPPVVRFNIGSQSDLRPRIKRRNSDQHAGTPRFDNSGSNDIINVDNMKSPGSPSSQQRSLSPQPRPQTTMAVEERVSLAVENLNEITPRLFNDGDFTLENISHDALKIPLMINATDHTTLEEVIRTHPLTVLIVLRAFGCVMCRKTAAEFARWYRVFEASNVQVVCIAGGELIEAVQFQHLTGFPGLILADTSNSGVLHHKLGCLKGWKRALFNFKTLREMSKAISAGFKAGATHGDKRQLGGIFVVDQLGKMHMKHVETFAGDFVEPSAVMRACSIDPRFVANLIPYNEGHHHSARPAPTQVDTKDPTAESSEIFLDFNKA